MKIKREFVLREIAGDILLVPTGKTALDLNGMLTLNGVGADIWKMLLEVENEDEIVRRLLEECGVICAPGAGFGAMGEGWLRLTAFGKNAATAEALRRMARLF